MNEIELLLIKFAIQTSEGGLKASELSQRYSLDRHEINRYLYAHQDEYKRDDNYRWTIKETVANLKKSVEETDVVLSKLNNRENAKVFTLDEFQQIADWQYGQTHSDSEAKFIYETRCGNQIECDSKAELSMLEYLEENDLIVACGGQSLFIEYDSAFRSGISYYPDIVVLTKDNHVAIIEVKAATAMDYHITMDKYKELSRFCEEKGYEYMMVDPDNGFITFEEVRDMDVDSDFFDYFEEWKNEPTAGRNPYKFFDKETVDEWYECYGNAYSKKEFQLQVHSLVMYYEWFNVFKNGFKVYSRPVKLDHNNRVIEYI